MQEMNPLVGIRLGHPKELSLYRLDRMLFQVGQDKEQFIGCRWERAGGIRAVAAARAGLSINGTVLHRSHQSPLKMRE
jgi:hypothetical protein